MIAFLDRLSPRERRLVLTAAALALLAGLWLGLVQPLAARQADAEATLSERQTLLVWLETQADTATRLRQRRAGALAGDAPRPRSLAEIEASLAEDGLRPALVKLAPKGPDSAEIVFEDVAWEALAAWMARTDIATGVARILVEARAAPGQVDAEIETRLAPPS
ncbi:MAG: type II secretion system protein GspM [Pseudomonadota bacterium]